MTKMPATGPDVGLALLSFWWIARATWHSVKDETLKATFSLAWATAMLTLMVLRAVLRAVS